MGWRTAGIQNESGWLLWRVQAVRDGKKKYDNVVLEKEKEIEKHDSKAQIEENVLLKDKLKKTSKSLKNSDKEASKALNKCAN